MKKKIKELKKLILTIENNIFQLRVLQIQCETNLEKNLISSKLYKEKINKIDRGVETLKNTLIHYYSELLDIQYFQKSLYSL